LFLIIFVLYFPDFATKNLVLACYSSIKDCSLYYSDFEVFQTTIMLVYDYQVVQGDVFLKGFIIASSFFVISQHCCLENKVFA
jgi:hypothetical protein